MENMVEGCRMDQQRLDAVQARCEAATPGKWKHDKRAVYVHVPGLGYMKIASGLEAEDAEFIAHARADVPDLLAEIERLTSKYNDALGDYGAAVETLAEQTKDRDAWRRRAEAAVADLAMAFEDGACLACEHSQFNDACEDAKARAGESGETCFKWRGPEEIKDDKTEASPCNTTD